MIKKNDLNKIKKIKISNNFIFFISSYINQKIFFYKFLIFLSNLNNF